MALVRISKDLLSVVEHNIRNMSTTVRAKYVDPLKPTNIPELCVMVRDAATEVLWGTHKPLLHAMPPDWIETKSRIDARFANFSGELGFSIDIQIPPSAAKKYGLSSYVEVDFRNREHLVPVEVSYALTKYKDADLDHDAKYDKVRQQVLAFLKECKSLNDALRKYPDLAMYVPQEFKDRVEEVRERVTKEKKETTHQNVEFDRGLISSVAVIAELSK